MWMLQDVAWLPVVVICATSVSCHCECTLEGWQIGLTNNLFLLQKHIPWSKKQDTSARFSSVILLHGSHCSTLKQKRLYAFKENCSKMDIRVFHLTPVCCQIVCSLILFDSNNFRWANIWNGSLFLRHDVNGMNVDVAPAPEIFCDFKLIGNVWGCNKAHWQISQSVLTAFLTRLQMQKICYNELLNGRIIVIKGAYIRAQQCIL